MLLGFFAGLISGSVFGIGIMCLFQINRTDKDN